MKFLIRISLNKKKKIKESGRKKYKKIRLEKTTAIIYDGQQLFN